jgi:hypothetical protein
MSDIKKLPEHLRADASRVMQFFGYRRNAGYLRKPLFRGITLSAL